MSEHRTVRAWLRVAIYLSSVVAVASLWSVHRAYAEARGSALRLGRKLVSELGPHLREGASTVALNGQPLFLSTRQTALSVREVLDRFSDHCVHADAGDPGVMRAALEGDRPAMRSLFDDPLRFAVLRSELTDEGMLACLQSDAADRSLAAVVARVRAFHESGDVRALGALRFVTARRDETGRTHVIAVWTQGSFALGALFPAQGDAPGSDLAGVARPPEAVRTLTATMPGHGHSLRLYESSWSRPALTAFYAERLPREGWRPMDLPDALVGVPDGHDVRVFTRAGRAVTVVIDARRTDARGVTLIDLGEVRGERPAAL